MNPSKSLARSPKVRFRRYSFSLREKVAAGRMRVGNLPAVLSRRPSPGLRPPSPGGRGDSRDTACSFELGLNGDRFARHSWGWARRSTMTFLLSSGCLFTGFAKADRPEPLGLGDLPAYLAALESDPNAPAQPIGFRELWESPAAVQVRGF